MFRSIGRLFGGAGKAAAKGPGVAGKAGATASKGGLLSSAKKFMGSLFGQAVLWAAGPSLVMGLFDGFSKKA